MSVSSALEECRIAATLEGEARRDPYIVVERLLAVYHSVSAAERREADLVFRGWLKSHDGAIWHLGMILVGHLSLTGAVPDLMDLADRFRASTEPGSPQWAETVDQIVDKLKATRPKPPTST